VVPVAPVPDSAMRNSFAPPDPLRAMVVPVHVGVESVPEFQSHVIVV